MSRLRHLLCILTICIAAGAVPAQAQEQVGLPELAALGSVRDHFVQTFNGRPLQVCRSDWESWNRVHGTCHHLVSVELAEQILVAGRVIEFVVYDGSRYERIDDASDWSTQADPLFDPDISLNDALFSVARDATLSRVGPAQVDGVAATQYQYWMHDETLNAQAGGQAVYDLFVSEQSYVLKSQFSSRGEIAGLGSGELAEIWSYRDFNVPIRVQPPSAAN